MTNDAHNLVGQISDTGVAIIENVFNQVDIDRARNTVLANLSLMKNTRQSPSSRHLAGFHRFPALEPLHVLMTANASILEALEQLLGPDFRTIGLSDITVNRSQQWHKDLLRGEFRHLLETQTDCSVFAGKLFKVIVYLQDSSSLRFVPGSHRVHVSLHSDEAAIPSPDMTVERVNVRSGDVVIIDLCTTHRGSDDKAFESHCPPEDAKVLISTVFGGGDCRYTNQMEAGNAVRMADWMSRHAGH